jgi:RNA polymerase sigma factor (TIGR02999 family)
MSIIEPTAPEHETMADTQKEVTTLLLSWKEGNEQALEELMPMVYNELRRVAGHHLRRERQGHTLQPTELIHEAYLRLIKGGQPDWQNRVHFYAIASRIMRQVLVEWARRKQAAKRGGADAAPITLNEALMIPSGNESALVALDDALTALAQFDPRACSAIEMKYFGGLSVEEIAGQLSVSAATVLRSLRAAEAWLQAHWKQ